MINLSLGTLAEILGKRVDNLADLRFCGVTIDSRNSCEGKLFVAIKGINFDGHNFVDTAYQNGATVALVEQRQQSQIEQIEVADCKLAMGQLANYWRRFCDPCVIALTGSNGKTTVKEMVAGILRQNASVLATKGNFNNELGLPLTLFQLNSSHYYAVLEMGASKPGDVAYLADIAKPDVGLVTNIGPAHLEGFISVEGVARAKGELYAALPPNGTAIINHAEPWVEVWEGVNRAEMVCYFNAQSETRI